MRLITVIILLLCSLNIFSQNDEKNIVWVKLVVKDSVDNKIIENAQIVSYETMIIYATDESGIFRGSFSKTDSLKVFGLGYSPQVLRVNEFNDSIGERVIHLGRKIYMIGTVDVQSDKELHLNLPKDIHFGNEDDLPASLKGDSYNKKPPIAAAVVNPLSYVNYYTSKREREKRDMRRVLVQNEEQEKVNEIYNRNIVKEVSGYDGEMLDKFMVYCNVNLKVTSESNPILVRMQIAELLEKFEGEYKK